VRCRSWALSKGGATMWCSMPRTLREVLVGQVVLAALCSHTGTVLGQMTVAAKTIELLVSRVVSDFTVSFWDNRVCLLLRRLCCVPVMSRD